MSIQAKDYIPRFQRHYETGVRLFLDLEPTGNTQTEGAQAALGICGVAQEMQKLARQVETLTRIFCVLDTNGRAAVSPIVEGRLKEIVELAKGIPCTFNDDSEATATEREQLQAEINRFIEAIPSAHLRALKTSSAQTT